MTVFVVILVAIAALHAYVAWHFLDGFGHRRHPLQFVAALEPLGWVVAGAYALSPLAPMRVLTLTAALFVGLGSAFIALLARHNRKLQAKWDARARALGGSR